MTEEIIYTQNPTETQLFFDFEFTILAWQLIKTTRGGEIIDPKIWESLYIIKQKYDKKNTTLKLRTKTFENKQKKYCEDLEARSKERKHYQEHIKRAETKLCEYKNTILAFGKLATCNSISK